MTLILGLLTHRYVLLASDRRAVFPRPDGSFSCEDDDRTKLAILGQSAVFGYTGVTEIDGRPTHEWFATSMKAYVDRGNVVEGLRELCPQLSREFRRPRLRRLEPRGRRHAFMGVGFKRRASTRRVVAAADFISNYHDAHGVEYAAARDEFTLRSISLKRGAALSLLGVGWVPPESGRHQTLQRYLRRAVFLNHPARAARVLAHEVRRVAAKSGPHGPVGMGLLVCCIPRAQVVDGGIIGGAIGLKTLGAQYVAASGTDQVSMFPAIVVSGFPAMIHEVRFEVPPPADGSDPYAEWRHELYLPNARIDRRLP